MIYLFEYKYKCKHVLALLRVEVFIAVRCEQISTGVVSGFEISFPLFSRVLFCTGSTCSLSSVAVFVVLVLFLLTLLASLFSLLECSQSKSGSFGIGP